MKHTQHIESSVKYRSRVANIAGSIARDLKSTVYVVKQVLMLYQALGKHCIHASTN